MHSTVKATPLSSLGIFGPVGEIREKMDTFRDVEMNVGENSEKNGSSSVDIGSTRVVCFVDGPKKITKSSVITSHKGRVNVFVGTSECNADASKDNNHHITEIKSTLESALQSAICLRLYPRAEIDVQVTILSDSGGVLAACVMAASLALVDAGIQILDFCVSAHVVLLNDERLLIDPSNSELAKFKGDHLSVTVGYMASLKLVVCCNCVGVASQNKLKNAISAAKNASLQMYPIMRQAVLKSAKKE